MTPEQFAYWLQGYNEVVRRVPNETQWKIISDHLELVFKKETPTRSFIFNGNNLLQPDEKNSLYKAKPIITC